jgi:hypothetical protein
MLKPTLLSLIAACAAIACSQQISRDATTVTMTDGGGRLNLRLNLTRGCEIDRLLIRGRSVLGEGMASGFKMGGQWFTTRKLDHPPKVAVEGNEVRVRGISLEGGGVRATEQWTFEVAKGGIRWRIDRIYSSPGTLDDTAMPSMSFKDMSTWTGALLGTGGVAWCKLFDKPNASYGIHTDAATFWNAAANSCFQITGQGSGANNGALRFTREPAGGFTMASEVTARALQPRHDKARFLKDSQDVWAAFPVSMSETASATYELSAPDFGDRFGRGDFKGFNTGAVTELLNTIGRIGVVDDNIVGSNGWYSGYACLHEPWLGLIGLALDDPSYLRSYGRALDYARDHAISAEGMVKSRWAYGAWDATAGTYDSAGFYEAQWGRLMDSQTSYVINVSDQFDLSGDMNWVAGQKKACESALEYLLRRDSNHNGLVEMANDSMTQKRSSDWLDIVWASFENALVNAQMYHALVAWAGIEHVLHDDARAAAYHALAARLKETFNKPISEGGFWDPVKGWYVYWREKDGSAHGDNLVLPVNLTALGEGLCDEPHRRKLLLDCIERNMKAQFLLAWPSCMFPFGPGEAMNTQWPEYENGDIFLAWAEYGVRAYSAEQPAVAFKYVRQIVNQYKKDGLAFQRYQRSNGMGAGDDILANNCNVIVGLYRDIYGIQPKHNRLYLAPRLTPEMNGTVVKYGLRGLALKLDLSVSRYRVRSGNLSISASKDFGLDFGNGRITYFPGAEDQPALSVRRISGDAMSLDVQGWGTRKAWSVSAGAQTVSTIQTLYGLKPGVRYRLLGTRFSISAEHPSFRITVRPGQRLSLTLRPE